MIYYLLIFSLFLTSCSKPVSSNTLRIAFNANPTTLNPREASDFTSSSLICLLFEGLTRCKEGSQVQLGLAQKVDISPDGKIYTFHLRKSFWSDGYPVTAYDFESSWKSALNPQKPSICAYLLYPIKNAEDYVKRRCPLEEVGIRALNAQTLQVTLEENTPYFLELTAFPLYLPTPSHQNHFSLENIIGNGPFQIEEMTLNHSIVLKKNKHFWDAHSIRLQSIHIHIISDEMTALQLFENQELDIVGSSLSPISVESLQNIEQSHPPLFTPMLASTFCTFNTESIPFSNLSIRKAFQKALDEKSLSLAITQMGPLPAHSLLPPAFFNSIEPSEKQESHRQEAKELFSQGLSELNLSIDDLEPITLYYKANSIDKKIAQMLQQEWKECLGIEIQIKQFDSKSLLQHLHQKNYKIALASWIAQFNDPINILERFKDKTNPKNYPNWEDLSYAATLNMAAKTVDAPTRDSLLKKARNILEENVPLFSIYHWQSPLLIHPRVKNLNTNATGALLIEYCYIED